MPYGRDMATGFHKPRRNKFGAVKTMANGILFDSKLEASEYLKLLSREQAGEISDLQIQIPYRLEHDNKLICRYIADFVFTENGHVVVADAKGVKTAAYQLKKKLVKLILGIQIRELYAPPRKSTKAKVETKPKKSKCKIPEPEHEDFYLWE